MIQQNSQPQSQRLQRPPPLFFLHINKTAGTSLYRYLEGHYDSRNFLDDGSISALRRIKPKRRDFVEHLSGFDLITKLHLDYSFLAQIRTLRPDMQALTVLRQPVDRVYSQIEAWRRVPDSALQGTTPEHAMITRAAKALDPEAFLEQYAEWITNRQSQMIAGTKRFEDQLLDSELLAQAKQSLSFIEHVGLTESLEETCWTLAWSLGLYNSFNSHRLNRTSTPDRLSDEERARIRPLIEDLNRVDLALYRIAEHRFFNSLSDARYSTWMHGRTDTEIHHLPNNGIWTTTMATPLPGCGWHEREQGVQEPARWAGPWRFSSLYLPIRVPEATRVSLELTVTSVIDPRILDALSVHVENTEVEYELMMSRDMLTLRTRPVSSAGFGHDDFLKLVIESRFTRSAAEISDSSDSRQKTIAIERITVLTLD